MDDTIQYDPRTKQQIKELLYKQLYSPVEKASKDKLSGLILRNSSIMGNSRTSFTYKGVVHSIEDSPSYRNSNRLHQSLYLDMNEYLKEVTQLNTMELPFVIGFINNVLNASNSLQDYLNVLPSSVHEPIRQLVTQCPCRSCQLSLEEVQKLIDTNKRPIALMKQRMVLNLLI